MRTGLCLGGPRHGEMVAFEGDMLKAVVATPFESFRPSRLPPLPVTQQVVIYIWHPGLKIGEDDIVEGFWVPEGTSLKAALKYLFSRAGNT